MSIRATGTMLRAHAICVLIFVGAATGCARQQEWSMLQSTRSQMEQTTSTELINAIREAAHPLAGVPRDYDPLMTLIGDARFVMLGEATHGTHEFYRERARITRRLIEEKNFNVLVLEADFPPAYRVNRYISNSNSEDRNAEQALSGFREFPQWMWRNTDTRDLINWLRSHNAARRADAPPVRLYGMDLYSLFDSAQAVVRYLEGVDPEAARRARERYKCFDGFRDDAQRYGQAVASGSVPSCQQEVEQQFRELQERITGQTRSSVRQADDELYAAYQNARVVRSGEAYYRTLYRGGISTWNLRDSHMAETLDSLLDHFNSPPPKVVVWAHNTHQGDARATEMGEGGELNVGQLMRQRHDGRTVLIGFTTYTGEVMAASAWGRKGERVKVRPALPESYAALFHETGKGNFMLRLRDGGKIQKELGRPRLERAIGVVYAPRTERQSHYFHARLSEQFDAVIHLDQTRAVEPLKP